MTSELVQSVISILLIRNSVTLLKVSIFIRTLWLAEGYSLWFCFNLLRFSWTKVMFSWLPLLGVDLLLDLFLSNRGMERSANRFAGSLSFFLCDTSMPYCQTSSWIDPSVKWISAGPCFLSYLNFPMNLALLLEVRVPFPSFRSFRHSPVYLSPFLKKCSPLPCLLPAFHSPT